MKDVELLSLCIKLKMKEFVSNAKENGQLLTLNGRIAQTAIGGCAGTALASSLNSSTNALIRIRSSTIGSAAI